MWPSSMRVRQVHRHIEYFTRTKPMNVTGEDYMVDVGAWAATASGLSDNHAKATWEGGPQRLDRAQLFA